MSPEKENDYFCAGMTEDLIIDLSKIDSLRVIPRSDGLPFRDKQVDVRKAGELLRAAYIVEGSVRKAGSRIRITAQLIDVKSGFQVWADRYDRLLEDIFEVQTEVSQKIAAALKLSLSESERQLLAKNKEVAVVGVPDADWGESVVAAIVKKEGHIPDVQELDLFCLEHIARFKRPKRYVFVDELPKNATGKVLKRELRERVRQE